MNREAQLAWVAGFYEGEGTFTHRRLTYRNRRGEIRDRHTVRSVVRIGQQNLEPLKRCVRYTGLGHINGPYISRRSHHRYWVWTIGQTEEVAKFVELISPYLSKKRLEQIRYVTEEVCYHPLQK